MSKIKFAFDINGKIVLPIDTVRGITYFYGKDRVEVFLKRSKNNKWFFCKKTNKAKSADVVENEMSFWHRIFKVYFKKEQCEFLFSINNEKHKTDIHVDDFVIEVQNSTISKEEFHTRNEAYKKENKKIIWIFNLSDLGYSEIKDSKWNLPAKCLCLEGFDFDEEINNDIFIYFHIGDKIHNNKFNKIINHTYKHNSEKNFKFFSEEKNYLVEILRNHGIYYDTRLSDIFLHCAKATIECLNITDGKLYYISNIKIPKVTSIESGEDVTAEITKDLFDPCWEIKSIISDEFKKRKNMEKVLSDN